MTTSRLHKWTSLMPHQLSQHPFAYSSNLLSLWDATDTNSDYTGMVMQYMHFIGHNVHYIHLALAHNNTTKEAMASECSSANSAISLSIKLSELCSLNNNPNSFLLENKLLLVIALVYKVQQLQDPTDANLKLFLRGAACCSCPGRSVQRGWQWTQFHVQCSTLFHHWKHRPLNGPVCHSQVLRPDITPGYS